MAIHYFHCTDGTHLILDREGRDASSPRQLARQARAAAEAVIRAVPSYDAWEAWAVYVYGERGQVAIVPFLPGLEDGAGPREVGAEPPAPVQAALSHAAADAPLTANAG